MAAWDAELMRRAIALAMKGRGYVEPNPMVGCVIATDGQVVGEAYHARFGGAHAEPTALAMCGEAARGATAYVTLEPCCHTNKKTPPCVPALIAAGIARVVVGCVDPNTEVNGRGIEQLRAAGTEVDTHVLSESCRQLLAPFIARVVYDRPYVTVKWAETSDGKVAGAGGKRLHISGLEATRAVHALRGRCDAIMVGINTVVTDDPLLTARDVEPARVATRYVLDRQLRISAQSRLAQTAREVPLVVCCDRSIWMTSSRRKELEQLGVRVVAMSSLQDALRDMYERGATHVLVEAGPTLAQALIESDLVDRIWQIRSPMRVDDPTAPAAPGMPGEFTKSVELVLGRDTLTEYLNTRSDVFFSSEPSADVVLT